MFTRTICLAGLLAGTLPRLGSAQVVAATPAPFYVGLGGSLNTTSRLSSFNTNSLAPTLTAGWQLSPRLAVQVSASYRQNSSYSAFSGRQLDANGQSQPGIWSSTRRDRLVSVPVLTRYTLTNPNQRLAVDLLGGATVRRYYYSFKENFTFDQGATIPSQFTNDDANTYVYLTLGPSLRYRLGEKLDLTGDIGFNYSLTKNYGSVFDYRTTLNRLSGNVQLGVRYRFGGR